MWFVLSLFPDASSNLSLDSVNTDTCSLCFSYFVFKSVCSLFSLCNSSEVNFNSLAVSESILSNLNFNFSFSSSNFLTLDKLLSCFCVSFFGIHTVLPYAYLAFAGNCSFHQIHKLLYNCQTQTGAFRSCNMHSVF